MASICITIDDDKAAQVFDRMLREASLVAGDMIQVRSSFQNGALTKTVHTECPWAFSVVRSGVAKRAVND